ncbi:MAG: hypothetical protein JSV65_07290 [Armatimonadota bacterium]|nr:MAG: hypothetical protein JSV65_07290 [Armatimonadota bacterium]
MSERARATWHSVRHRIRRTPDLRACTMIVLMSLWILLNIFDLLITYDGLASGIAYEANRVMSRIIEMPALATATKMSLAYVVLKLVERVEVRTPYTGLAPLLAANVYLCWACLHNLNVLNGADASRFLHYYPLTGLPN